MPQTPGAKPTRKPSPSALACQRCGEPALRRNPRSRVQRALSVLVPFHRYRCGACRHVQLQLQRPGLAQGFAWATLLLIAAAALRSPADAPGVDAAPPASAVPVTPAAAATSAAVAASTSQEEARAAPTIASAASAPAAPAQTPAEAQQPGADASTANRVRQVDARFAQGTMRITLDLGGPIEAPIIRRQADPARYFIDLPGHWELPSALRCNRSFKRSPLKELQCERSDERLRLRLTFVVRDPKSNRVWLATTSKGLVVSLR